MIPPKAQAPSHQEYWIHVWDGVAEDHPPVNGAASIHVINFEAYAQLREELAAANIINDLKERLIENIKDGSRIAELEEKLNTAILKLTSLNELAETATSILVKNAELEKECSDRKFCQDNQQSVIDKLTQEVESLGLSIFATESLRKLDK
jgi:hypothetical protein